MKKEMLKLHMEVGRMYAAEGGDTQGLPEVWKKAKEALALFSFRKQQPSKRFREEDVRGMGLAMVFLGTRNGQVHPYKEPGSWSGKRSHVFAGYQRKNVLDEIQKEVRAINVTIITWQAAHPSSESISNKLKENSLPPSD
jgi:hypothetical protein